MTKPLQRKIKPLAYLLLISLSIFTILSLSPQAKAETKIGSINPQSGTVGTSVQLTANISTQNGQYVIKFDTINVTSGIALGKRVITTFTVPDAVSGSYTVTLIDITANENANATFTVTTAQLLEVSALTKPLQYQQGDSVNISAKITGGAEGKTYAANITVRTPANVSYQTMISILTSTFGNGSTPLFYPQNFSAGASTNFTGAYKVFFNGTLAQSTFTIGLTNATQYHRKQTVDIKAQYRAGENVTVKIVGTSVNHSANLTADSTTGIVHYNSWAVPLNASIGSYQVTITSRAGLTSKNPPDAQNFTVPGFEVNVTVRNRAGEPVRSVSFRVYEFGKSLVNRTTNTQGMVFPALTLEIGNYSCEAYYRDTLVGKETIEVTAADSKDFYCNLTNLRITVTDVANNSIPDVALYVVPENQTFTTYINGSAIMHSLIPNKDYKVNASRYGALFNETIIHKLPVTDWYDVKIVCPNMKLQIQVKDWKGNLISDATVKLQEAKGGALYEKQATNGFASFENTFGNYTVEVYVNGIRLNRTKIELFQNRNVTINCALYGLSLTVKVVDYFGQPISNLNIVLQREDLQPVSQKTNASGITTFDTLIGGSFQVSVYLPDGAQPFMVAPYTLSSTTTYEIKLESYTSIAGFLVQTSQLATALLIIVTLIFLLAAEFIRRRSPKTQESIDQK